MLPRVLLAISITSHSLTLSTLNHTSFMKHISCSQTWEVFVSISTRPRLNPPEEHPHSGPAGSSVSSASSHIFPIQLAETAGALRAQHGPTEQAQGGMLPLIICGLGAPEDDRGAEQVEHLWWLFHWRMATEKDFSSPLTENGWLD